MLDVFPSDASGLGWVYLLPTMNRIMPHQPSFTCSMKSFYLDKKKGKFSSVRANLQARVLHTLRPIFNLARGVAVRRCWCREAGLNGNRVGGRADGLYPILRNVWKLEVNSKNYSTRCHLATFLYPRNLS